MITARRRYATESRQPRQIIWKWGAADRMTAQPLLRNTEDRHAVLQPNVDFLIQDGAFDEITQRPNR